ncbi:MAG: hydroxyacid dehydrogenase [Archangium gephyra]|uniref:Hydroxyacid dehydrogenase n=1 Tax=Archangium gephyra TaxID=48 RepID=A0A2W5UI33_9BACT|nr:MAG: hydroxyacid dehydrogenase [Archangium gephyra]
MKVNAWAAAAAGQPISHTHIERREVGPKDVLIEILWSGICHSDLHQARAEWGPATFPMVPGHEIVGRVTKIGADVKTLKVGDLAGVGCLVDSCRECSSCTSDDEQFCEKGAAGTYNSTEMDRKTPTYGGYSSHVVVTEHFAVRVPDSLDPSRAAPLLCAGITTYSPLRQFDCKPGSKVGVVGLGGLGHMAVKLAAAMGAEVTMLSTSPSKKADAQRLGAANFELTTERATFRKLKNQFDLIIDTVSATHDLNALLRTLKPYGTLALVGLPPETIAVHPFALVMGNRRFAGSNIGGIRETQEMLEFCALHKVMSDVEVIEAKDINVAWERMVKNDVRYRFVIDGKSF